MIGIIGAMEEEITNLKSHMEVFDVQTIAGMSFFKGAVKGTELVLVRSGIGKVNAGICTQILASVFNVDTVINTGIAGSLNAAIDIGDIVVSTCGRKEFRLQTRRNTQDEYYRIPCR